MQVGYKIQYGQSIYDVCLMLYGSLDYLFTFLTDNNLTLSSTNITGLTIYYNNTLGIDNRQSLRRTGSVIYCTAPLPTLPIGAKFTEEGGIKFTEEGGIKIIE